VTKTLNVVYSHGFLYEGDNLVLFNASPSRPAAIPPSGIGTLHSAGNFRDVHVSQTIGKFDLERRWCALLQDIFYRQVRP
jgi:hypothetical protein